MKVPRRSPRRRTIAFTVVFGLVALLVVGTFAESAGQKLTARNNEKDDRNALKRQGGMGEIYGNNPTNDCWAHHKGEGMRDTVIVYPVIPLEMKLNQRTIVPVQIVNPWKHELRAPITLEVALLGEQLVAVEGQAANAAAAQDIHESRQVCVGPLADSNRPPQVSSQFCPTIVQIPVEIPTGATQLIARAQIFPGKGATEADTYTFGFRFNTSRFLDFKDPATSTNPDWYKNRTRQVVVPVGGAASGFIEIEHRNGNPPLGAIDTMVHVNWTIVMAQGTGAKSYSVKVPFDSLAKNSAAFTEVAITPFKKGVQNMEFKVRSGVYYQHQDPSTPSIDYFKRYANLSSEEDLIRGSTITPLRHIVVTDRFVASPYEAAEAEALEEDWRFVLAEISGFAAAGLLVPSLLLGGTYGKGSRRFFNNVLGGAKRRVMFHNIMSLGLSLVAVIHILLFMLEIRYTILMGVMWGGLGALSLLVLGLTGYYQVPLIQRHGYKWWRFTHLAFGLLVVVFVSYHAIADGPDFYFLKENIPKWINDVNLAQK